jgi:lipopolysaccharide biosynthesis glycosyltransferase
LKKKIKIYDKKQEGKKPKEFDIKKAIKFVAEAWDNVTPITINNCWKKTGILPSSDNVAVEVEDVTNLESDIENLINKFSFSSPLTAKEYISIDDKLTNSEMVTEEEIINSLTQVEEEEEEVMEHDTNIPNITIKDAVNAFETAYNFLEQGNVEIDYNELKAFKSLKRKVTLYNVKNQKQTCITGYFK